MDEATLIDPKREARSRSLPGDISTALERHGLWLEGSPGGVRANFSGATLADLDLTGVNLRNAILKNANLLDASLSGADLSEAELQGSDLRRPAS